MNGDRINHAEGCKALKIVEASCYPPVSDQRSLDKCSEVKPEFHSTKRCLVEIGYIVPFSILKLSNGKISI